jgi:hypothetical protein
MVSQNREGSGSKGETGYNAPAIEAFASNTAKYARRGLQKNKI